MSLVSYISRYYEATGNTFASSTKCKSIDDRPISQGQEMSKGSKASSQKRIPYEIGPPAWIKKKILNTNNRYFVSTVIFILINLGIGKDHLSFPQVFFL